MKLVGGLSIPAFRKMALAFILLPMSAVFLNCVYSAENSEYVDFMSAKRLFTNGFYELSGERLEAFLKNYPDSDRVYEVHSLLGRCHYRKNEFETAAYEFETVLGSPAASGLYDEAIYWYAETAFKSGDIRKALEYYQRIIDGFPSSAYLGYSVYSKGWVYYRMGMIEDALKCFREAVSGRCPENVAEEACFRIGECVYLLGHYSMAEEELGNFMKAYPLSGRTAEALFLIGEANFKQGAYKKAEPYFRRAVTISPLAGWSAFVEYRIGCSLFQSGDYNGSEIWYKRSLEKTDRYFLKALSYLGIARCAELKRKSRQAGELYDVIITAYPNTECAIEAYRGKARLFYGDGDFWQSESICREAIAKHSKDDGLFGLRYELARALEAQDKYDEAAREYESVLAYSSDKTLAASAAFCAGDLYLREKKYDLASKKYDLVLEKYPDSPVACDAQYRMAGIFFEKGNFEQAIIAYQSVLGNFSGTSLREKTVYSLGVAYFKKGDYQSSEEEFKKLLRDFSNTPLAPRARFYLGSCLYSMGRYDEALEAFKNSSRSFTDRGIAMRAKYQSGWCYYNMHKDQEAVSEFNEFLRRYPDTPLVYDAKFWLGEYYTSKAKYEKAREYFLFVFEKCREDGMARQALYNLSMTYYWEGRYDDAAIHLEGFALKYPGTELAFSAYRKIARIKKDKRDLDGAVVYLRRSLTGKDLDSDAQARYEIAECLEERGDLETAVKEYLRVSRDYPDRVFWVVRSDLRCAIIFEKLNRLKDALVLYERLSDMDVEESKFARERLANLKYKLNPKLEAQRKKSDHETAHNLSALS